MRLSKKLGYRAGERTALVASNHTFSTGFFTALLGSEKMIQKRVLSIKTRLQCQQILRDNEMLCKTQSIDNASSTQIYVNIRYLLDTSLTKLETPPPENN